MVGEDEQEESLFVEIPLEKHGERIDRVLASLLSEWSRERIKRFIAEGRVRVDGVPIDMPRRPARAGERVELLVPRALSPSLVPEARPLSVLYEDAYIAVIEKPRGVPVHPSPGHEAGTLVHALLAQFPDLSRVGGDLRPGIVHRLDKDTTGLLVVAKSDASHLRLARLFAARSLFRGYVAVVHGRPDPMKGTIVAPIGRDPRERKRMAVVGGGREAITHYRILLACKTASLVALRLETGRTHQIRVHMRHIGHPVVGDPVYGFRREQPGILLLLHAFGLRFPHPITGELIRVYAPPPEDFREAFFRICSLERRAIASLDGGAAIFPEENLPSVEKTEEQPSSPPVPMSEVWSRLEKRLWRFVYGRQGASPDMPSSLPLSSQAAPREDSIDD